MRSLVFLFVLVLLATSAPFHYENIEEWRAWKTQHGKGYTSELEELERHLVWLSNKKYIDAHNANEAFIGFRLAMNMFGDMTDAEYISQYSGFYHGTNKTNIEPKPFKLPIHYNESYLPRSLDWRTKGAVSKVEKQGNCRSCYAFSAIGALESAYALANNELVSLSEQNIVDCSGPFGNNGCNGGDTYNVFEYIIANGGVDTALYYPYKARQGQCKFSEENIGSRQSGIVAIDYGSESDLKRAVALVGPVSVAVDARSNSFRFYRSGVFNLYRCSSNRLTHAMLVTGYGWRNRKKYWRVKNSWGGSWGMYGYILMSRDKYNQCGIASHAFYPTL